jgi:hypothetical protein
MESRCNPLPCPAALAITVDGISLPDLLRDTFRVRDPQEPDEYKGLTHAILDSCSGFDFLLAEIDHKPGFDCVAGRLCHPHSLDHTPTMDNDLLLDNWTYNGPLHIIRLDRDLRGLALHWAKWIRAREEWNDGTTSFLSMARRYTTRTEYYWSRDTATYPVQAQADNLLWRAYARLAFEGIAAELRPLTDNAHSLCERTRLACPHWRNATSGNSPYFTPCTNVIKALDPEGLHGARIIWPLEWATKIDADESLSRHIPKPKVLWNPQDGELKAYEFLEWVCDGAFQYDWEPSFLPPPGAAISVARWKQLSPILQVKALQILGQHLSGDPNLEYPTIHSRYLLRDSRPSHPDPRTQSGPLHFVVHTHPTTKRQIPLIVTPAHQPTLYTDNAAAYYRLPKPEFPAHAEQAPQEDSYMEFPLQLCYKGPVKEQTNRSTFG